MAVTIPENLLDLLTKPIICGLITLMPDGQPQATPVWCDYDGTHVIINTARGRQKERNMKIGSKVTVLLIDPQNQFHWAEIRGSVDAVFEDREAINKLSLKYTGNPVYQGRGPADEVRVTFKIALTKVNGQ